MNRILIAGVGNIFHGDDAFGAEVARQLTQFDLPAGVQAVDFGIRSYDLAFAIADGYDAVIFVDTTTRGEKPGTLCLLELNADIVDAASAPVNGHSLNPFAVLQFARASGAALGSLYLVGCEPAVLDCEDGQLRLSPEVAAAVPRAITLIRSLVATLTERNPENSEDEQPGLVEAARERS